MQLAVDTDAFCKLGISGLLDDALVVMGVARNECGRLPALPYMLQRGKLPKQFGAEACVALIPVAMQMEVVSEADPAWLEELAAVPGIDPGEAILFATAAGSGMALVTGDKRSLTALARLERFRAPLAGRLVVLEALLLELCDRLGVEVVRARLRSVASADTMIMVCFSDGNDDPRAALSSYLSALASAVDPLQLWMPRTGGAT